MSPSKVNVTQDIYVKLAKTLRKIGEFELAVSTCKKGIERFPESASLYNVMGESLILKFNTFKRKEYIISALKCFEKALIISPYNYLSKIYSLKIYLSTGDTEKAESRLTSILSTAPDNTEALRLKAQLEKLKEKLAKGESKTEYIAPDTSTIDGLDIKEELKINYKTLIENLSIFRGLQGLNAVFLIDQYGNKIKGVKKIGIDDNLVSAVIANIYRSSSAGVEKMGLGAFKTAMFMTPMGNFFIANLSGAILLVITAADTSQKEIDSLIVKYLENAN